MRRPVISGILCALALLCGPAFAQSPAVPAGREAIDGVAARIGNDIILESEVKEMQSFQMLVGGQERPRDEVIHELVDQWIIQREAADAGLQPPDAERLQAAYLRLESQFSSPAEFREKIRQAGLTEAQVRGELSKQLYFNHLLRFRFRPSAVVDDGQIADYYNSTLKPQLEKNHQAVPPLAKVSAAIRALLVEREIDRQAQQWLQEMASRLNVDILPEGGP